jgi:hypothetical protein
MTQAKLSRGKWGIGWSLRYVTILVAESAEIRSLLFTCVESSFTVEGMFYCGWKGEEENSLCANR